MIDSLRIASDRREVSLLLSSLTASNAPVTVAFVNAHVMNLVHSQPALANRLRDTDYVFRDGIGMELLLRSIGRDPGQNLNGTDLIPQILARARGSRIALFGTSSPYLERAAEQIATELALDPTDMVLEHGFHQNMHYLEVARECRPDLVVLGMGVPKQEDVAALLKENLDYGCVIVCGGAVVDFYGGKVTRAPRWIRNLRMEWAYRLALEPRRLFWRYVVGNPAFLVRAARLRLTTPRRPQANDHDTVQTVTAQTVTAQTVTDLQIAAPSSRRRPDAKRVPQSNWR